MPRSEAAAGKNRAVTTRGDIKGILGDFDSAKMLAILSLRPSITDVEEAAVWLEGDADVFGAGEPTEGVMFDNITILTEDEELEPVHAC